MVQRVLVTAGASGIGREIVRAFTANGAKVFVCDIDAKALDGLTKELPGVKTSVCDISSRQDIERMVSFAVEALGGLDVLVNNAGISGPTAPVEKMDPDEWEKVVQVDLNGTFNVTRLAIPHLKKSLAGVIIIMSSVAGRFGYPNRSPYSTTKWESPRRSLLAIGDIAAQIEQFAGRSLLESADAHRYPRVRKAHDEGENQKLDYLQLCCRSERGQRLQIPRRCWHLGSRPGCEQRLEDDLPHPTDH
jgi:hypothetical protein